MPQLPSCRHVGVSVNPALDNIKQGDFVMKMKLLMGLKAVEVVKYLATIVYYRDVGVDGLPVNPYASELSQSDIEQRKAGWTMKIM